MSLRMIRRISAVALVTALMTAGTVLPCRAYFTEEDEQFLDGLERDTFTYFIAETNPANGLIKDSSRPGAPCSIAAVGYGLVALCIGESRGWIEYEDAYTRAETILRTFLEDVPHERGFFYHFLDMRTGKRVWNSELSSIDTALFIAGALVAGAHFRGTDVEHMAYQLYHRIEWDWMLNGRNVLCMGWKPESGFLPYYWDSYSELMLLYALAIGSPTHPVPAECWGAWERPRGRYAGWPLVFCQTGSLFVYLQSHAWIDFRNLDDNGVNYWRNTANAVRANRQFCADQGRYFSGYSLDQWGLSASLGPEGYKGYGAKPGFPMHDGTIAPFSVAAALPFLPKESLASLKGLKENWGGKLYGMYGFKDAFNQDADWWADEYLGIDQGIALMMIENARTGMIWDIFMRIEPIQRWVEHCFPPQRSVPDARGMTGQAAEGGTYGADTGDSEHPE